jgi:hypothetical protein
LSIDAVYQISLKSEMVGWTPLDDLAWNDSLTVRVYFCLVIYLLDLWCQCALFILQANKLSVEYLVSFIYLQSRSISSWKILWMFTLNHNKEYLCVLCIELFCHEVHSGSIKPLVKQISLFPIMHVLWFICFRSHKSSSLNVLLLAVGSTTRLPMVCMFEQQKIIREGLKLLKYILMRVAPWVEDARRALLHTCIWAHTHTHTHTLLVIALLFNNANEVTDISLVSKFLSDRCWA